MFVFSMRNMMSMLFLVSLAALMILTGCEKKDASLVYPSNDSCSVDEPRSGDKFTRDKPIIVKGWAADVTTGTIPEQAEIYLVPQTRQGGMKAPLNHDLPRQDVADYFKNPGFVKSGYSHKFDISSLAPGVYRFAIIQTDGQRKLYCAPEVLIDIQ